MLWLFPETPWNVKYRELSELQACKLKFRIKPKIWSETLEKASKLKYSKQEYEFSLQHNHVKVKKSLEF